MSDMDPKTDTKPGSGKPDSSGYGAGGDAKDDIQETAPQVAPGEKLAREN
jgi:hypothetical protein